MKGPNPSEPIGWVASLHLHPREPGQPLGRVDWIELVEGNGIAGEPRYFARLSQATGRPSRRQISLIERERIAEHAVALGLETIAPGAVRSNIETVGIDLTALVGRRVALGDAILFLYEARTPCAKMDAICIGLRALMENGRQGVMAEVVKSGRIHVNDSITAVSAELVP